MNSSLLSDPGQSSSKVAYSKSSLWNERKKQRGIVAEKIKHSFVGSNYTTVHWDGKIMPDLNNKKKESRSALYKRHGQWRVQTSWSGTTAVRKRRGPSWSCISNAREVEFDQKYSIYVCRHNKLQHWSSQWRMCAALPKNKEKSHLFGMPTPHVGACGRIGVQSA